MPVFRPVVEHPAGHADRLADGLLVEEVAAGLQPRAQKGVRGAAGTQVLRPGEGGQRRAVLAVGRQRLLAVDVLAGLEGLAADRGVRGGDRQVDDDLDLRFSQQFLDGISLGKVVLRGLRPRAGKVQVRAGGDLEVVELVDVPAIDAADVAAADDADLCSFHKTGSPRWAGEMPGGGSRCDEEWPRESSGEAGSRRTDLLLVTPFRLEPRGFLTDAHASAWPDRAAAGPNPVGTNE